MVEELVLTGNKYYGRFLVDKRSRNIRCGDHYTEHERKVYWYKGEGLIKNLNSEGEVKFILDTKDSFDSSIPLEEYFIWIKKEEFCSEKVNNSLIVKRKDVMDILLESMCNEVENRLREGEKIIPSIVVLDLIYEDLLERGLIAEEKTGQIKLGLSYPQ
ncbi:MAG: hypothetical protein ABIJ14_02595 [Nanoarchaeota archaeon]|nr:hypothetical protein [Nanoarchaeota archaeon]